MTPDQLMRMTVKDLRALAERQGLPGVAKMRKDELIGLLAGESVASVGLMGNEKRVGQHVVNPRCHRRIRSAVGLVAL